MYSCTHLFWIALFVIIFILWNQSRLNKDVQENWTPYVSGPYGTIKTGSSPLRFYTRMLYRKPFGYPYKYYSTYPMRQLSYYLPN